MVCLPTHIMVLEMVKMTDEEYKEYLRGLKLMVKNATVHPDGVRYRLELKCIKGYCSEVRRYMAEQGFEVTKEKSFNSDHYGVKRFKTPVKAIKAMNDIYKKYTQNLDKPKIEFAGVIPILPSDPDLDKK